MKMPRLTIDNRKVEVRAGATILEAAEELGIDIPTMCFLKGYKPATSCMVCVVKVAGKASLVPSCGMIAEDGMSVQTDTQEVAEARTAALELLLSDHVGDCIGPCHVTCPAGMNIPLMIRQIAGGDLRGAIETIKKDIALPAVLGRICPAPCEKSCRRGVFDEAVSVCLLKRYAADVDLMSAKPYLPACRPSSGKRVAIAGAGPAGLAAAYYLLQKGHQVTCFDEHDQAGGMLRYGVDKELLPETVLDKETSLILELGADFKGRTRIGTDVSVEDLAKDFDAVFVAAGVIQNDDPAWSPLERGPNGIVINRSSYETSMEGVFAGGDCLGRRKLAVRAVAHGKEAAVSIDQYLSGEPVTGPPKAFNSRIGKLKDGEINDFLRGASESPRVAVLQKGEGFNAKQAAMEAERCLHCDCRKPDDCKLRQYAHEYSARQGRYKGERRRFEQQLQHPDVIYEPGKCIKCGLCIQTASEAKEELGLTFIGRGFDVQVAVPFGRSIAEGLKHTAAKCVQECPTGALAFKKT
jgi:NADPH-dependent glutamate synthase beta subunit-like oxidoreductase